MTDKIKRAWIAKPEGEGRIYLNEDGRPIVEDFEIASMSQLHWVAAEYGLLESKDHQRYGVWSENGEVTDVTSETS